MAKQLEVLKTIERAALRTARFTDLKDLSTNVWRDLDKLVEAGAVIRLAHGVYTAPPDGRDGRLWKPSLEIAGLALATARHGSRSSILMGLGAARYWGAIPRAIADTVVAVPVAGLRPAHLYGGTIHFVAREIERVEASAERTELGSGLIATREQTLFDLLTRPKQGGDLFAAEEGARNLIPQADPAEFDEIVQSARQVNAAVREVHMRLQGGGR